jgi:hypothetical protein
MQDAANTTTDTIAFHGDLTLKHRVIQRIRDMRDAGDCVAEGNVDGMGAALSGKLNNGKRDAFGQDHFPSELGLPEWLGELANIIARGLPDDTASVWPEVVLDEIAPGDDLEQVINRLGVIRTTRVFKHVKSLRGRYDEAFDRLVDLAVSNISLVIDLHHGLLKGESRNLNEVIRLTRDLTDAVVSEIQAEKHKPRTDRLIGLHVLWRSLGAASASALWTTRPEVTFEAAIIAVTACAIRPGDPDLMPKHEVLVELWKTEAMDLLRALRRSQTVIN